MKSRIRMIIMTLLICVCVAIPAVSLNAADESDSNSNNACEVVKYEDLEEVKDYLAGKNTYPTKEGYLFAGWYTTDDILGKSDAEVLKYAIRNSAPKEGTVYALFVPAKVLDVKAQLSSELLKGLDGNEKGSIRFVTTVNSLLYQKVGFEVSYINSNGAKKSATSSSNKVYDKLYAVGSTKDEYMENGKEYLPTEFSDVSKYFKACNLKNIPASEFGVPITVKPFWVTLDGSKVYGETVIKSMDDYFLEEDVYVSNSDNVVDKADAEGYGTAEKPYATLNYALSKVKNQGTVHVVETYATDANFDWEEHNKTVNITGGELDFTTLPEVTLKEAVEATAAVTATGLDIRDSVTFTDTVLNFTDGHHIYANGNTVEIASDITWGNASAYVHLYGGAHTEALKSDTNLILKAGQYARVYGGGNYSALTGNVNLTLSGEINSGINYKNSAWTSVLFGGGHAYSKVTGDINITIADETVLFNWIYGGANGPNVTGDIRIDFAGKACGIYGGGYGSTVTGDTYVNMTGGWVEQIFGGGNRKNVTGSTNVHVQAGTVMRRVYGGCYNELASGWETTECVKGYSNVSIGPNAKFLLNSYEDDNSIYAISRGQAPFTNDEGELIEKGTFIFNETSYKDYQSKLGINDTGYESDFSQTTHHYLITTNGNTADESLGTVTSDGAYIRINPRRGYSAVVVDKETNKEHYTESEGVYNLPELTSTAVPRELTVTFNEISSNVDKSGYEARIDGAYYESFEDAIAAVSVLDSKGTVTEGATVTLLRDVTLDKQIVLDKSVTITTDGVADRTIYAGAETADSNIIVVNAPEGKVAFKGASEDSQLILDGDKDDVTLKGAFIRVENADNQKFAMEYLTVKNIVSESGWGTAVSAVKSFEAEHCTFTECSSTNSENLGGVIYTSAGATGTKIIDCQFEGCSTNYQGGAIYTKGEITVIGSQFAGCRAENRGGAIYSEKGMTITECIFGIDSVNGGNTAGNAGGAICVANKNVLNIVDTIFIGNKAEGNFGGAIAMSTGTSTVNLSGNITFDGNSTGTTSYGGGAIMTGSVLNISDNANVTIKNNVTKGLGGGIFFNATNAPEFTLGEDAVLTMTGNTDINGTVDIAIKNGGKPAEFNLSGSYAISSIYTTADSLITLTAAAKNTNSTITMVTLIEGVSGTSVTEGEQLVIGSAQAGDIFSVVHGETEYTLDNAGCLVAKKIALKHGDTTTRYETLAEAVQAAVDEDTIVVEKDVILDTNLTIGASVTIITDGVSDRTIYCGAGAASGVVISVAEDKKVTFIGATESTQLIFDGNEQSMKNVFIAASGEVRMKNVTMKNILTSGSYGAAVCITSPATVENCSFINCSSTSAKGYGGAIYISAAGAGTSFTDCDFIGCTTAGIGGAICTKGSNLSVDDCCFTNCVSTGTSAESTKNNNGGGAIYVYNNLNGLTIVNSTFKGNSSEWRGGAIHSRSAMTITNCTFGDKDDLTNGKNTSDNAGGAVHMNGAVELTITKSNFYGNEAGSFGGAISFSTANATLNLKDACTFSNNKAKGQSSYYGGAIMAPSNFNIKTGAMIKMYQNECTDFSCGDAISINSDNSPVTTFVVETGAALYVYNNPSLADGDNDICNKKQAAIQPNVGEGGTYSVVEPQTTE